MIFTLRMILLLAFLLSASRTCRSTHGLHESSHLGSEKPWARKLLPVHLKLSRLTLLSAGPSLLDFEKMSENALRAHWAGLSEAQRSEFVHLFRALFSVLTSSVFETRKKITRWNSKAKKEE